VLRNKVKEEKDGGVWRESQGRKIPSRNAKIDWRKPTLTTLKQITDAKKHRGN